MSLLSMVLCMSMLIGTTFAWFTDTVTSSGNIIKSGTLDVSMEWTYGTEDPNNTTWTDASVGPIFESDLWEPGYTEARHIKIENKGSLALKYQLKIIANGTVSDLADVIDVYYVDPAQQIVNRSALIEDMKMGTLSQTLGSMDSTASGNLAVGESVTITLALKMQESAGNDYQNKAIGSDFSVQLIATQLDAEVDSFDEEYDKEAPLDYVAVSNEDELKIALANHEENIVLTNDIIVTENYSVDYDANIDGAGYSLRRTDGTATVDSTTVYTDTVFTVTSGGTLVLLDIVVDGGAKAGIVATGALVLTEENSHIVLNKGAVLQNNNGALAVNLGTRIGATLTLNGGEICNNSSDAGAVWGGGHITINSGKINNNSSTGLAGAIRMVSNCNLTMNGGEICNNTATTTGGAIYGYGASTYNFNGGKMSGNTAATGGAMYTGDGSVVNISGTFELTDNTADEVGGLRLSNYTSLNMSGGTIAGNESKNNPSWDGFYGWNPGINFTGGEIVDDVTIQGGLTPTVGGTTGDGVIHFDLSTNHNTVNLIKDFKAFKFTEADNFSALNFKPASDYTYTEGDEAKLICMNEGYETYWDATSGTFRLQAK